MNIFVPQNVHLTIDQDDLGTLCICSLRYAMGRRTYMPSLVRDIIKPILSKLSDKDIKVIFEDCDRQEKNGNYGDESIDKPGWVEWFEIIKHEMEERKIV